jgi:hypothetical protein
MSTASPKATGARVRRRPKLAPTVMVVVVRAGVRLAYLVFLACVWLLGSWDQIKPDTRPLLRGGVWLALRTYLEGAG